MEVLHPDDSDTESQKIPRYDQPLSEKERRQMQQMLIFTFGTLGILIQKRAFKFGFQRSLLFGHKSYMMAYYGRTHSLKNIAQEIGESIDNALYHSAGNLQEALRSLQMLDKMLPPSLPKLIGKFESKYCLTQRRHHLREAAALKLIIDFKI